MLELSLIAVLAAISLMMGLSRKMVTLLFPRSLPEEQDPTTQKT